MENETHTHSHTHTLAHTHSTAGMQHKIIHETTLNNYTKFSVSICQRTRSFAGKCFMWLVSVHE